MNIDNSAKGAPLASGYMVPIDRPDDLYDPDERAVREFHAYVDDRAFWLASGAVIGAIATVLAAFVWSWVL